MINVILALLSAVIIFGIAIRFLKDYAGARKCAAAEVLKKECFLQKNLYKNQLPKNEKEKAFFVSGDFYFSCEEGQKGKLEFKGSRIIDFQ